MKKSILSTLVTGLLSVSAAVSFAQTDGEWNANSGDWGNSTNWVGGNIANGTGSTADFIRNYTADPSTINIAGANYTVGKLLSGDTGGGQRLVFSSSDNSKLIFDNGASPAEWTISSEIPKDTGQNSGLNLEVGIASAKLIINNQSANATWAGFLSAATSGNKTIVNESTGTGDVIIGRNPLSGRSGAGAISDGTGVLSFHQNSTTSRLFFSGNVSGADNLTFTGGLIWDKGDVAISGKNPLGAAGGVVRINAENGTLYVNNSTPQNTDIRLNANITIDSGATSGGFGSTSVTTLGGNRTLAIKNSGGHVVTMGNFTDNGNGYTLTKEDSGLLRVYDMNIGVLVVNNGTVSQWGSSSDFHGTNITINNGSALADINRYEQVGILTLNNGTVSGFGRLLGKDFQVSLGTISTGLANFNGTTTANLVKETSGTVTLSGGLYYTGNTVVNAGRLIVTGDAGSIKAVVNEGGELRFNSTTALSGNNPFITLNGNGPDQRAILSGTGSVNKTLTLDNTGDTLSPGNSPGIMNFGVNQSWSSFTYVWESNNWTGVTAGVDFDKISINGNLTLTGGTGSYILDIVSLTSGNSTGQIPNFSEVDKSWVILSTTAGISGFSASNWTLETGNFTSSPSWIGSWNIAQDGNNLVLNYAVPEPGVALLVGSTLAGALLLFRRRRDI